MFSKTSHMILNTAVVALVLCLALPASAVSPMAQKMAVQAVP